MIAGIKRRLLGDGPVRSPASARAFEEVVLHQPAGARCLSVGGGPLVVHDRLINLNIEPFENVQVVGTAYRLPFADDSVDSIYCEAVLEHLEDPELAVKEMFRVLVPGGQVFAATPFLQVYHAYPDHYQNFTLSGHCRLFQGVGFQVLSSGPCVGPTFAVLDIIANYCREYLPTRFLSRAAFYLIRGLAAVLQGLDGHLLRRKSAHVVASSTFVQAAKPIIET
ncbi:MAG: class I SAM-dependent methyltransferase [Deltaproteobacteria bacterium]|nr:class I SAM-dependent methyltransferase [Deltaproteobacteria bacterium]